MAQQFSIFIPSWNNLPFLQKCIESIRRNSTYDHQIIVHVNEGTDGTLEWVRQEGLDYTWSEKNIGVCLSMNMMRSRVKTDYICFMNDDMYVLPEWDKRLVDEIRSLPDNRFFLSATVIQPHTPADSTLVADFGDSIESFREADLLREYKSVGKEMRDWFGATMPPNVVHRDLWDLVGGYSVELTPGMYSDPDFTAKLWLAGVRYMKGLAQSRVYHFETKSTTRIRKNDGSMQFLLKWGMTSSTFRRQITRRGEDFDARLIGVSHANRLRSGRMKSRLKALWLLLTRHFGPINPLH
ncbi:MAG: glycosyltransferase [Paludibacteraceae bacterium]|nr:glycosyltransferase [Paludibacteraceae bacterium]